MEDSTNKVVTMVKGLPRFDGKDKHAYRDWKARVKVHLSVSAPDIYGILMGQEQPNPTAGGKLAKWQRNSSNFYSVLFLATNGGATTVVRRHEGKTPEDGLGDGQAAWKALEDKYDAVSNATRQELYEELTKTNMGQVQDSDSFLYIMETARDHLHDMREYISSERFGDRLLNALTPDYDFVRNTSFINREFGLEIKSPMRNVYTDLLSRRSNPSSIAGRGIAMQTQGDLSGVQCYIFRKFGHLKEDCSKYDPNYKTKGNKHHPRQQQQQGGGGPKWCVVHLTTSYSDDECKLQKKQANNGTPTSPWASNNTSLQHQGSKVSREDFRS